MPLPLGRTACRTSRAPGAEVNEDEVPQGYSQTSPFSWATLLTGMNNLLGWIAKYSMLGNFTGIFDTSEVLLW